MTTAARPNAKDFNEAVGMDLMINPDRDNHMHVVIVVVHDFTPAISACPGSRPTAELAWKSF